MGWILLCVVLLYVGALVLFCNRFYLPRVIKVIPAAQGNPYPLARFVHGVLDVVHAFAFFVAIVLPPIWVAGVLIKTGQPDLMVIKVLSDFYLDTSQFAGVDPGSLRDTTLNGTMEARFEAANLMQWFVYSFGREVRALLVLFVILHVRNIFAAICNGDAFTLTNALRLRWIGIVTTASFVLAPLWQYVVWTMVASPTAVNIAGLSLSPAFDPSFRMLFVGLVVLVLSGVLKEAVQLQEEQRLTI